MTSAQESNTGNPILSPSAWGSLVLSIYSRDEMKTEMKEEGLKPWSELSLNQQAGILGSAEAVSHISGPSHFIYGAVFNKDGHFYGVDKGFAKANIIPNKREKRSYLVAGDGSSVSQKCFGIGPIFLRSEPSSNFVALFGSQDPEIKNNAYPITTPEGPLTVTNAETSEMEPVQLRQYGTGGHKNNFDATAHSDVNKFKYQAHTSSQHAVRGHKLVTLENGTQVMALTLITALVITSMQYLLTEANLLNPSKSNGGDDMRSRLKKLNKEKFKKLKKSVKEAEAYKEAENELFVECLKEDVANSFTVEDSDIFKPVVKFTQKRIKNEETGKYETDPASNDKGGIIYLTMKKSIFTNVYENSTKKKVPFPSETITGIPKLTLELAYTGGKNFQHVPLVSGEDPSKELPCEVRDSLQPGAILNGVVQIKFVKTPTGSDARAKIQLERLQLLDQGDGTGADSAQEKEQAMLLKPIRFGKPMLTAPPVASSAPPATKRKEPSPTEEKEPRESPKKRRKVLQEEDDEGEDGEGAPAKMQAAEEIEDFEDDVEPTQEINEDDMAPLE